MGEAFQTPAIQQKKRALLPTLGATSRAIRVTLKEF